MPLNAGVPSDLAALEEFPSALLYGSNSGVVCIRLRPFLFSMQIGEAVANWLVPNCM